MIQGGQKQGPFHWSLFQLGSRAVSFMTITHLQRPFSMSYCVRTSIRYEYGTPGVLIGGRPFGVAMGEYWEAQAKHEGGVAVALFIPDQTY